MTRHRRTNRARQAQRVHKRQARQDYCLICGCLLLAALCLLAMEGCSYVATVRQGARYGKAAQAWVTVAHVASSGVVLVETEWGTVTCDAVRLQAGSVEDPWVLLLPRQDRYRKRVGPGDSGSPVVGPDGRVIGLLTGHALSPLPAWASPPKFSLDAGGRPVRGLEAGANLRSVEGGQ